MPKRTSPSQPSTVAEPEVPLPAQVPIKAKPTGRLDGYAQAKAYLDSRLNVEAMRPAQVDSAATFNLDRMRALMAKLGNPQNSFLSVHVAGSKGKGSVCEMLGSVLATCRCTVGLYTSPHLVTLRERIRLQGHNLSEADFARLLTTVVAASADIPKKLGEATYFELLTAMMYVHFAEQAVDVGIIEVGLGGEHDATNVITPAVSIITALQKEHTQLLGTSLAEIARAKSGIIKPGVACYTLSQPPEAMAVLEERAAAVGAPLKVLGKNVEFSYRFEALSPNRGLHAKVCLTGTRGMFEHLVVPLHGEHQALNCGLALGAIDALRERGFSCPDGMVAEGLRRTPLNGRLERVSDSPPIYVDGAHNPESVQAVVKSVASHLRPDSMVVVFGCASDKDIARMLPGIAAGADKVIFTRADSSERSTDPRDLARKFSEISSRMYQIGPNLREALGLARRAVGRGDIILVTGSFLMAGQAKRILLAERSGSAENKPR
ncbi:MAG: bifunctional folylpolyglutamate synthase/dihydrofolate synthase [Phycisphaerales bacterium]